MLRQDERGLIMKKFLAAMLAAVMLMALTACGGTSEETDYSAIEVDEEAGSVSIYAMVNGAFFDTSTMHYIVYSEGNQGENAMFAAFVDSQDFYDALEQAGGKVGDGKVIKDGEFVNGQPVDITLTWDGQDKPVKMIDTITTKGDLNLNMVFGGAKENNANAGSGCISCLNSCWAGITSNAGLPFGAVTSGKPAAYLNKDVVPEDGTVVKFTFTLK